MGYGSDALYLFTLKFSTHYVETILYTPSMENSKKQQVPVHPSGLIEYSDVVKSFNLT